LGLNISLLKECGEEEKKKKTDDDMMLFDEWEGGGA